MDSIIQIAVREMGVEEVPGEAHNQRILDYAREAGFAWVSDDETPWCSVFLNWCARRAGLEQSRRATARSWLTVGMPVEAPEPGDVVVFWRDSPASWKGHVGLFLGYAASGDRIYCLGGNQGDRVCISAMAARHLLGFRRLQPSGSIRLPNPPLQRGDSGDDVRLLQDALKYANFDCGTSDGIFGPMTERAVQALQSTDSSLPVSGEYDVETMDYLQEILNE